MKDTIIIAFALILVFGALVGVFSLSSSIKADLSGEESDSLVTEKPSTNTENSDSGLHDDVGTMPPDTMPDDIEVPNDGSNDRYTVSYYDSDGKCGYVSDGSKYYFYTRVFNTSALEKMIVLKRSNIKSYSGFSVDLYFLPTSYGHFLKASDSDSQICLLPDNGSSDICYTTVSVSSSVNPVLILEDLKQNVFGDPSIFSYTVSIDEVE